MAPTIEQIESMSDTELRVAYNETAKNTVIGLEWYREEIHWRILRTHTEKLSRLTWAIAGLTAVNAVLVAATLL